MTATVSERPVHRPGQAEYALEAHGLSKAFQIPVLDDLSLGVRPGELVCLLGPNGRGKTTLLRDVNAAQVQVAELWKQRDAKAVDAMVKVTKLPEEVVREALGRTTPLSGLADQDIEVIPQQLKFNREHGTILQSDVWTEDPATMRREIFVQVA